MTITKDTPVTAGTEAQRALERLIRTGTVNLTLPKPPRFLFDWLDLVDYQDGDTQHRRTLATDALERERLHRWGMKPANAVESTPAPVAAPQPPAQTVEQPQERERTSGTPERLPTPFQRARPGTPYVPCAAECGALLRRPRASVAYCHGCGRRRPKPKSTDIEWSTP
ncbi:hypothetical protein SAMN04487783_2101 [Agrococcus baldri]|uniref:Uncharacterized protein n=1 Tax=Agrococcus baldri TaxID=153730 RepID=A0AA94HNY6_9MICO|nr:hypothetical protein SAMN04487783_2101 [Agrococcus baldri]